ncbi:MAG TPA: type II secretion system F family protein [Opitutaceae bacterium]|jgi:general secretion pathway protein F|nr:type II secretion system F family protein [Opitutaceae bacterium]
MPRFAYNARDHAGTTVSATLDAPSRKDALRLLAARGLHVTTVAEETPVRKTASGKPSGAASAQSGGSRAQGSATNSRQANLTHRQRLPFLQALHDLTSSGLSAGESVRLLSVRLKEPALRTLCTGLWNRLSEGQPLSRAMEGFPAVFDSSTISLIQAGEATGSLNEVLGRLISHLTEQRELQRQLLTALAYPVLLMFAAGGVVLFFLFFLLPRLQTLFDSLGGKIPTSTQILIGFAHFALHWGWLVIALAIFGAISFWRWRQTEPGRVTTDAFMLKVPLLGPFVTTRTVHAISHTLALLLENGITTADALRMTERQIMHRVHRRAFGEAIDRVIEGESLSLALSHTGCFPELMIDRLAIGENTGNIVPSLKDIARNHQKIISQQLDAFTRILATVMLLTVFTFVGFLAFAIVSAIFNASAQFNKM